MKDKVMDMTLVQLALAWTKEEITNQDVKDWSAKHTVFQPIVDDDDDDDVWTDGNDMAWADVDWQVTRIGLFTHRSYANFYNLVNQPTER